MVRATYGQFTVLIHWNSNQAVACSIPAGHSTSLEDPASLRGFW